MLMLTPFPDTKGFSSSAGIDDVVDVAVVCGVTTLLLDPVLCVEILLRASTLGLFLSAAAGPLSCGLEIPLIVSDVLPTPSTTEFDRLAGRLKRLLSVAEEAC